MRGHGDGCEGEGGEPPRAMQCANFVGVMADRATRCGDGRDHGA